MMECKLERDQGFTLIELMVVMIIISILSSIAIPIFMQQRQKGFEATMRSDLRTVALEMEAYAADDEEYPVVTTSGDIATLMPASGSGNEVRLSVSTTIETVAALSSPGNYCLRATTSQSSAQIYFDSDGGGLQLKGVPCQ